MIAKLDDAPRSARSLGPTLRCWKPTPFKLNDMIAKLEHDAPGSARSLGPTLRCWKPTPRFDDESGLAFDDFCVYEGC